jgi:hypothetical protein
VTASAVLWLAVVAAEPGADSAVESAVAAASARRIGEAERTMRTYFAGEMGEAWFWRGFGVAGVAAGIGTLASDDVGLKFMSIPLLVFGAVQLALGVGLSLRTPPQVAALSMQLGSDPAAFAAAERTRMARVNRGFVVYRLVELLVLTAGAFTAGIGWVGDNPRALGLGLGLAVESLVFLGLDFFADRRAHGYERALLELPF